MDSLVNGAEKVAMFCRLNINNKKDLPIRSSEMGLIIMTVKSEAPVTPVMAADFFKVKKPMITTMVNALCEKGYLVKVPSETDKRSVTLHPTEKGTALAQEAYEEYFSAMKLLKTKLGDSDYHTLMALIDKANHIMLEEKSNG